MSVKGLEESERLANGIKTKVKQSLQKQLVELRTELAKVEYLLGNPVEARRWANAIAPQSRLQDILAGMSEVEQLYLDAGDSRAAQIFKQRMQAALKTRLTNLKANELEVVNRIAKNKLEVNKAVCSGLSNIRREGALREMYTEARNAGGFLTQFGRPYLTDLVTLETKAAGSKTLGHYMSKMYTKYENAIKDVFIAGIVRGDSYKKMEDALVSATKMTDTKANLIITTEANAIFNQSVRDVIEQNPLVKGYRFRAVLDSRTSKICQQHDGDYIPKEDVQPGINYPPLHPRCRSTVTTVLYDEDERKDTVQRYTKNDRNQWEKVPPGMTYQEYKDKFGFANSKNPRTYNPMMRDIRDETLARVGPPMYRGYVKPSISSAGRIQKLIDAYIENDTTYIDTVLANTQQQKVNKALFRQAQAESGFDGLPLQLNATEFDKQVEKNGYRKVYRRFTEESDLKSFLEGNQLYGSKPAIYGPGTYTFTKEPTTEVYGHYQLEMALKTPESKILKLSGPENSQIPIGEARTPDARINTILEKTPPEKRRDVLSLAAVEYGYDAIEVTSQLSEQYVIILNRSAVITKELPQANPDVPELTPDDLMSTKPIENPQVIREENIKNGLGDEYTGIDKNGSNIGKFEKYIYDNHPEAFGENLDDNLKEGYDKEFGSRIRYGEEWGYKQTTMDEYLKMTYREQQESYPDYESYVQHFKSGDANTQFDMISKYADKGSVVEGLIKYNNGATDNGYGTIANARKIFDEKYGISKFIDKNLDVQYNGGELFRGISTTKDRIKDILSAIENGESISMNGLSSWSTKEKVATEFTTQTLVKRGKTAVVFRDVTEGIRPAMPFPYSSTGIMPQYEVVYSGNVEFVPLKAEIKEGVMYVDVKPKL